MKVHNLSAHQLHQGQGLPELAVVTMTENSTGGSIAAYLTLAELRSATNGMLALLRSMERDAAASQQRSEVA